MVNNAPIVPDIYRDNEKHVENFADHIRQKAQIERKTVEEIARDEVHRFRDIMFWVNTQYDGSQLRIRNLDWSVLTKLKKGAQINIVDTNATFSYPDNDRWQGHDDAHVFVFIEANEADTEAGGTGKVRWWVSTEYIQSLSEPVEPPELVIPPEVEPELPPAWEKELPKPPEPNPDVLKPKTEETEKPGTLQSPDSRYTEVLPPPVSPTQTPETQKTEKPGTLQSPNSKYTEAPTTTPQKPKPTNENEKPGAVQFAPEKPIPEKKWFFWSLNDALNNFHIGVYNTYKRITGGEPVISEESTTTTNSGELVIKPANAGEKPTTTAPESVEKPELEKKKIVTDPTE
jgi:hypothetical protein